MMLKVAVAGALGKMGRMLVALVVEADDMELVAAIDAAPTPGVADALAKHVPGAPEGVVVEAEYKGGADVIIDFSFHAASAELAEKAAALGTPLVIGTTGLSDVERERVERASHDVAILFAPNMSVGANVMFDIAARMASMLGGDFDVEIVEAHHRFKKDAPSGTALEAARRVAEAKGLGRENIIYGREGETGARPADEIAVHALRAGDIVGEHRILFSCLGETLELTHRAHTRECFVRGALRGARWLVKKEAGLYGYADVLAAR
jgi:4-hydroxy-tetrahydrodipicolinate reductase